MESEPRGGSGVWVTFFLKPKKTLSTLWRPRFLFGCPGVYGELVRLWGSRGEPLFLDDARDAACFPCILLSNAGNAEDAG